MDIGKLNQRIRIEQKTLVKDPASHSNIAVWAEFATVWASVDEVLPAQAERYGTTLRMHMRPARIRVRHLPALAATMRVVLLERDNRLLQIVSGPVELGKRAGMEIMCEEYSTQGDGS